MNNGNTINEIYLFSTVFEIVAHRSNNILLVLLQVALISLIK